MSRRGVVTLAAGAGLALVMALLWLTVLRPTSSAVLGNGIEATCVGVGAEADCARWAASVLDDGPGIRTFDPDDLVRLRLVRPALAGDCEVEYYVGRSDEPAAREPAACPPG